MFSNKNEQQAAKSGATFGTKLVLLVIICAVLSSYGVPQTIAFIVGAMIVFAPSVCMNLGTGAGKGIAGIFKFILDTIGMIFDGLFRAVQGDKKNQRNER